MTRSDFSGNLELLLQREWLATNGLGGFASGSIAGVCTRRYHALLVAAMPAPLGRTIMANHLAEEVHLPDARVFTLSGRELGTRELQLPGAELLGEFRLELALPVWRFEFGPYVLEKRLFLPHRQNTVHIFYSLLAGPSPIQLKLRPALSIRAFHDFVTATGAPYNLSGTGEKIEIVKPGFPTLRMQWHAPAGEIIAHEPAELDLFYRCENRVGYDSRGPLWTLAEFQANLQPGGQVCLTASTEDWGTTNRLHPAQWRCEELDRRRRLLAHVPRQTRSPAAAELILAADQFVIKPVGRTLDRAAIPLPSEEVRTIVAGYPWFSDWGRDTMISLEGLTLVTGRYQEARSILLAFAADLQDGLVPNTFPEGQQQAAYSTADATLWYFHALDRYAGASGDRETLRLLLPILHEIIDHHLHGTKFGIGVDPRDGLLCQGQEGYQLTWMDAKVGDWVVTPRRGKAVEINALWYNALRLLETWTRHEQHDNLRGEQLAAAAEQARHSFNERFWYLTGKYLYDVIDGPEGNDAQLRPNQLFAISLTHPVLDRERWGDVLGAVSQHLLTPVGLRSLAPREAGYQPTYEGDLRSRDAAYHQGTVWAWLIGPYIDAWLKVYPDDRRGARELLSGLLAELGEGCIGTIGEIFDAEPPHRPRGCFAQAWSVAEALRCWVRLADE
ncbi:MAG: glycogen debranching enzyme family protein [Planctomycetia bacterium]|nr:glycogen debranching enzyme family protein [Planctomycetia bacterium]